MSWKNIKEHYRIGHIVGICIGSPYVLCIGSPYVHDLLRISADGTVKWGTLGPSSNADLARYYEEMTADTAKLKELIETPDTFSKSLPVYTYDGGEIIEKQCEEYGWPNVTHDGEVMYDNVYFADKMQAVAHAKSNAQAGIKSGDRGIADLKEDLAEVEKWRAEYVAALARLEHDFPNESNDQDQP